MVQAVFTGLQPHNVGYGRLAATAVILGFFVVISMPIYIAIMSATHPAQALQILRVTAGACKVENLLQSLSSSPLIDIRTTRASTDFRKAFASLLKADSVEDAIWSHATIPLRMGGLGLRDPITIVSTARLASLVNVSQRAIEMGASQGYIAWEL